ncbi:phosphatase PAP2 family protein [Francisellaceae bacterium]|nr:phosphatase PAP2 family protein [Francisellaceae bacterium]
MKFYKSIFKHGALFICAVFFSIISYFYFDIPLVNLAHDLEIRECSFIFIKLTQIPEVIITAMYCLVPITLLSILFKRSVIYTKWVWLILLISLSLLVVLLVEDSLEYICGRYWPATWVDNNPSWLSNQVYGMNWFQGASKGMQAFPSGHTAVIFTVSTMLWKFYPKYKYIYVLLCVLTMIGLMAMYYHWLSDIIFGAYIGYISSEVIYGVYMQIKARVMRKTDSKY